MPEDPGLTEERIERRFASLRAEIKDGNNAIQAELREKHQQNRDDIKNLGVAVTAIAGSQNELEIRLAPAIGLDGKSGTLYEMAADMKALKTAAAQGAGAIAQKDRFDKWLKFYAATILTLIGLLLAFISISKAKHEGWIGKGDPDTVYAQQQKQDQLSDSR